MTQRKQAQPLTLDQAKARLTRETTTTVTRRLELEADELEQLLRDVLQLPKAEFHWSSSYDEGLTRVVIIAEETARFQGDAS